MTILVEYHPPRDFNLRSPPYYRTASSVSFTCSVANGVGPVAHAWSSTCSRCFVSHKMTRVITEDTLTRSDAGIHKCSVRDVNGNRGFATTEMKLYGTIIISYDHTDYTTNLFAGAGIYVTGSGDVFSTAVVNNTVIRLACATCPLDFSCYTNESSSATIVFPNGISRSSYNSREQHISSLPDSGINLRYSYYLYSTVNPPSGVYTCRFVQYGTGRVTEVSIGVNFDYNTSKSILYAICSNAST